MSFVVTLVIPPPHRRADLLRALGVDDDPAGDGAPVIELGRPATGATALLSALAPEAGRYRLELPLVRAAWSAADVLPSVMAAVASFGGATEPTDPLAAWRHARIAACRELALLCESQGAPPPPFLPAADVDALHRWLVAIDEADAASADPPVCRAVFVLDPQDGTGARVGVRLPRTLEAARVRVPELGHLLVDLEEEREPEEPRLFALAALGPWPRDERGFLVVDTRAARDSLHEREGEPIGRYRFVAPVEVIEAEVLAGSG